MSGLLRRRRYRGDSKDQGLPPTNSTQAQRDRESQREREREKGFGSLIALSTLPSDPLYKRTREAAPLFLIYHPTNGLITEICHRGAGPTSSYGVNNAWRHASARRGHYWRHGGGHYCHFSYIGSLLALSGLYTVNNFLFLFRGMCRRRTNGRKRKKTT